LADLDALLVGTRQDEAILSPPPPTLALEVPPGVRFRWSRRAALLVGSGALLAGLTYLSGWWKDRSLDPDPAAPPDSPRKARRSAELNYPTSLRAAGTPAQRALGFAPNGRLLAWGIDGAPETVELWDLVAGRRRHVFPVGRAVTALTFCNDGRVLAVGTA